MPSILVVQDDPTATILQHSLQNPGEETQSRLADKTQENTMQITETMDLNQLSELIEKRFNRTQMNRLCVLLNETKYASLEELPPAVWESLLELVLVEHPHS